MKGVIYAAILPIINEKKVLRGSCENVRIMQNETGITILGTYIDRALSAKTDNRPEFSEDD